MELIPYEEKLMKTVLFWKRSGMLDFPDLYYPSGVNEISHALGKVYSRRP